MRRGAGETRTHDRRIMKHDAALQKRYLHRYHGAVPPASALAPRGIKAAQESRTLLTAELLDLDHKHEIIRRVHQERDQAPAV